MLILWPMIGGALIALLILIAGIVESKIKHRPFGLRDANKINKGKRRPRKKS